MYWIISCIFIFTGKSGPPPNQPPKITIPASLLTSTPIIAQEGKLTAKVQWALPIIEDQEDGKLEYFYSYFIVKHFSVSLEIVRCPFKSFVESYWAGLDENLNVWWMDLPQICSNNYNPCWILIAMATEIK